MSTVEKKGSDAPSAAQKAKETKEYKQAALAPRDLTPTLTDTQLSEWDDIWVDICNPGGETYGNEDASVCGDSADENMPCQDWTVTKKGYKLATAWRIQKGKRDQDAFDMYIFNDWTGYGICEVMENMFLAFNKVTGKKQKDPFAMWSHIEGMALFVNDDIMEWHMLNDSEGNAKRTMLIGTALLTTLYSLSERTDIENLCDIRNASVILAQFLMFAQNMNSSCTFNENGWKHRVLEKADELNIVVGGFPGIEEVVAKIRHAGDNREPDDTRSEEGSSWKHSIEEYSSEEDSSEGWITDSEFDFEDFDNCLRCYKNVSWAEILNSESLAAELIRTWRSFDWVIEFAAYSRYQAVKVGPGRGPVYGGDIGGKFYDLTAQRNKRPDMKQYRLSEGT